MSLVFQLYSLQVFKRWDMALYEEAMSIRGLGKTEFTARCESIAKEIFPVEQQVLNSVGLQTSIPLLSLLTYTYYND